MNGRPDAPPIAVTGMDANAVRIIAHEPHAPELGLAAGQTLSDARTLVPELECHTEDESADHALLISIAAWCERYTPLVALDAADSHCGLFMDVTGCTHLLGGEENFITDMTTRLKAQGFHARLCLADTAGAAWAMARYGSQTIIECDQQEAALAPLPLSALRLDADRVTSLSRVGLKTIGCITGLPRAPLTARFGRIVLDRLDQALGFVDEVISPLMPVAELAAEKRLADPIVHEDDIRRLIGSLAQNIIVLLERRGLGARTCELRLFRIDGHVETLKVHAADPVRDPVRIEALFHERLAGLHDDLDAGFGFDLIRLNILKAEPFDHTQHDLAGEAQNNDRYHALLDRLGARLGQDRVLRFALADTHIPERRFALVPVTSSTSNTDAASTLPSPAEFASRPLFLLERPERIEVIAQVPDSPPSRFRWRKVAYEVTRAEGPERIACEWWRDGRSGLSRDYFRIEAREGHRFWLFRHGLYGRETSRPDWYMHGLFA